MNFYKKIITVTVLIATPIITNADAKIDQALDNIYGQFDKVRNCWIFKDNGGDNIYCMKIDQYAKVNTDNGKERTYVLLAGDLPLDKDGYGTGAHVDTGRIAALIFEKEGKKLKLIAGDLNIEHGTSGVAPTGWKLMKVASSDYWGWQNTIEYNYGGYIWDTYYIIAPYGKTIKEIAGIDSREDDTGSNPVDLRNDPATVLESNLSIDTTKISNGLYQLIAKTSGQKKGKKVVTKTWKIPFDKKTWSYKKPKGWPINVTGK